jgi:hypothetical protein
VCSLAILKIPSIETSHPRHSIPPLPNRELSPQSLFTKPDANISCSAIEEIIHNHDQALTRQLPQCVLPYPRQSLGITNGLRRQQTRVRRIGTHDAVDDYVAYICCCGLTLNVCECLAILAIWAEFLEFSDNRVSV